MGTANHPIQIPSIVYRLNTDNTACVMKYLETTITGDSYTVPDRIKETGETIPFLGEEIPYFVEDDEEGYPITSISSGAYQNINFGNTKVYMGKHVTSIGSSAFSSTRLTDVYLENVETLGDDAFYGSTISNLTATKLKTIGDETFSGCGSLKEINLPAIETLVQWAFYNSGVENVTLGENLKQIGTGAFSNCSSLKEVIIRAQTLPTTPTYVFSGDSYTSTPVNSITLRVPQIILNEYKGPVLDDEGNVISYTGWHSVPADNIVPYELSAQIGNITYFFNIIEGNQVELAFFRTATEITDATFTFPSQFIIIETDENGSGVEKTYIVVKIDDFFFNYFANNANVTKLVLPDHLSALSNINSILPETIEALEIADENVNFKTQDGVLYNGDKTVLICYPKGKPASSFTAPSTIKIIAENAFAGNKNLENITFAESEQQLIIGSSAFNGCSSLEQVTFQSLTPCLFVGYNTFNGCHYDLKIYVPDSAVNAYKQNAIFDTNVAEKIQSNNGESQTDNA